MANVNNVTCRIEIRDPKPDDLRVTFPGRNLDSALIKYCEKAVFEHKGGIRKIVIPSGSNVVGVILLGCSSLEEAHLHIHEELHVFNAGKVVIVRWLVRGVEGLAVPEEAFSTLRIDKVKVHGEKVTIKLVSSCEVDFIVPVDFALYPEDSTTLDIEHPLIQKPAP